MTDHRIICGDSLHVLPTLDAESVDAIVCDPPYGLSFMGKEWDHGVPGEAFWREALRVAKPGAHLLAFGGSRTYHRLACAIEDAGWEIRDCLSWLYGSGFPKSLDVSKAMDKMDAAEEQMQRRLRFTAWVRSTGATPQQVNAATGTEMGHHYTTHPTQPAIMTREHLEACRHLLGDIPEWVERECDIRSVESRNFAEREVVGRGKSGIGTAFGDGEWARGSAQDFDITAPATALAREWQGWGTALKPAWEPIIFARKPLVGTVASNVAQYGTGALNVDGCRIAASDKTPAPVGTFGRTYALGPSGFTGERDGSADHLGRWPANVCLDEAAAAMFPESRFFYTAKASRREREAGLDRTCTVKHITGLCRQDNEVLVALLQRATSDTGTVRWLIGESGESILGLCQSDSLSTTLTAISRITTSQICNWWTPLLTSESTAVASLWTEIGGSRAESVESESESSPTITSDATASALGVSDAVSKTLSAISDAANWSELRNIHSTVKPIALMRWLCRLVTPKGGLVLDPFTGSGSTGCAAVLEGFRFVGVEREPEYAAIAEKRIAHWAGQRDEPSLFDG